MKSSFTLKEKINIALSISYSGTIFVPLEIWLTSFFLSSSSYNDFRLQLRINKNMLVQTELSVLIIKSKVNQYRIIQSIINQYVHDHKWNNSVDGQPSVFETNTTLCTCLHHTFIESFVIT